MEEPLGGPRLKWKGNIKRDVKEQGVTVWTGFKWLRLGPSV
jgi:hypothetical protein